MEDINFRFNAEKYNYWPVYEAIHRYYPIGIPAICPDTDDPAWQIYHGFRGQTELGNLITENFTDQEVFAQKWTSIGTSLGDNLGLNYTGTTYGEVPSYSFYLEMFSAEAGGHTIYKRLHVAVSLLGPFFTIWGADGSVLQLRDRYYPADNVITISPFDEYEAVFNAAYQQILSEFPDYRFVPYGVYNMTIPGLAFKGQSLPNGKKGLIYHALFNYLLSGHETIRGEKYFSFKSWLK
jgi:hypothetical protein